MVALTLEEMMILSKVPCVFYEKVIPVKRHHRKKKNEDTIF